MQLLVSCLQNSSVHISGAEEGGDSERPQANIEKSPELSFEGVQLSPEGVLRVGRAGTASLPLSCCQARSSFERSSSARDSGFPARQTRPRLC